MTHPAIVRNATAEDVASWLELAQAVEPQFGPMPDIASQIQRGLSRGIAIVVEAPEERIDGAALLSRNGQPHRIKWLKVRPEARRRGVGSALLGAIMARCTDGEPICVVTFGADVAGGEAARALYAAHGLHFDKHTEHGPEGGSREQWIRQ